MRLLALLLLTALATGARAQHDHAAPAAGADPLAVAETFAVDGLRVEAADPPPGSAVARASVRWADGGYATVVYGRPFARGRLVFGGLVAWDTVWVAGAHRATELWTTAPLVVGAAPGVTLAPGGYGLFVTPRPSGAWTVHVNRALGMHLADDYDAALDLATVDVAPMALDAPAEALTWAFEPDGRALLLRWAGIEVSLPVQRAAP